MKMNFIKGDFFNVPNKSFIKGKKAEYRSVYLALCDHANSDGQCFPSRSKLASDSGVSVRTVDKVLGMMITDGIVVKNSRMNKMEKMSNVYQLMLMGGGVPDALGGAGRALGGAPRAHRTISNELHTDNYRNTGASPQVKSDQVNLKGGKSLDIEPKSNNLTLGSEPKSEDIPSEVNIYDLGGDPKPKENVSFSQIASLIKLFEGINPGAKLFYRNKTQREACKLLIKEFGFEAVELVVTHVLPETNVRPRYEFPYINSPDLLIKNWSKLKDGVTFKQKEKQEKRSQVAFIGKTIINP